MPLFDSMPKLKPSVRAGLIESPAPVEEKSIEVTSAILDIRRLIDRATTEADWIAVIATAMSQAKDGDNRAREFLFKYKFGLPPQMVKHTGKLGMQIAVVEVVRPESLPASADEIIEGEVVEVVDDSRPV